ncbi:flagellar type III secretion system protein FlhB [Paracoccus sp. SCSIO 75233]|uniref:flagellar type III secretion system protein FlhB n=1 Tax=Paracoccus sp. SCSIO 75233 TaxID=3017782 RepID=UPI0022F0256A|nr:flagellar type III secretion system protein FlhB [Paracoccus sp. SCSIO 75233]WBU53138.1 flagellar type III secretion system protein FlhB [Paracoccus sp. SCSIO 75233]
MSDDDNDDKQFPATEQKLRKAREKGDFPRSTEVNAALAYLGVLAAGGLATAWAVPDWLSRTVQMWREIGLAPSVGALPDLGGRVGLAAALLTLVLIVVPALVILLGLIVQRGIVFVPSKIAIKPSRINPVQNAKQKFGKSGFVTFLISTGKAFAVGLGGWLLFRASLSDLGVRRGGIGWIAGLEPVITRVLLLALAVSIIFAIAHLAWKHFDFRRRNRMTLKELKDEMKESEGDPHLKAARRRRATEIVMSSMLADVAAADVVIVNPTHFAVALRWKRGSGRAPVCVAKGVDEIALRIRARAGQHDVPIWPDPPCARAIHATVNIGAEISYDHFAPVAAAIRFAETMRQKAKRGW